MTVQKMVYVILLHSNVCVSKASQEKTAVKNLALIIVEVNIRDIVIAENASV